MLANTSQIYCFTSQIYPEARPSLKDVQTVCSHKAGGLEGFCAGFKSLVVAVLILVEFFNKGLHNCGVFF